MSDYDAKLDELFIDLPLLPDDGEYALKAVISGKLLYIAGMLPHSDGKIQHQGRVGVEVRQDNAKQAARMAAVNVIAAAKSGLGGKLSKIRRVVKVDGMIACGQEFRDHFKVLDGASQLFVQIFGINGKHVRTAAGAVNLPQNACIELSVVFEIK